YSDSSALEYYNIGKNHYILHKETRELLEFLLNKLAHDGEELTLYYIKNNLLKYNSTF
ncbi:catalase, partial [Clostridium botulinum]|nr:catalase [Clostridium botulinum]